jgi:hypothetical protein
MNELSAQCPGSPFVVFCAPLCVCSWRPPHEPRMILNRFVLAGFGGTRFFVGLTDVCPSFPLFLLPVYFPAMDAGASGGAAASDAFGVFDGNYSAASFTALGKRPAAAEASQGSDDEEVSLECALVAAYLCRSGKRAHVKFSSRKIEKLPASSRLLCMFRGWAIRLVIRDML